MTIDEMKQEKAQLEEQITLLLREFERRTGAKVKGIDVERIEWVNGNTKVWRVNITTEV